MILKDLLAVTNANVLIMGNLCEMAIVNPRYSSELLTERVLNKTIGRIETRSDMFKVWLEEDKND